MSEFSDPRLVAIYDSVNTYGDGTQPDFYAQLATEVRATTIIDIGCGTGIITCDLARRGYRMIGLDPAPAMLEVARCRQLGDAVEWIEGDAAALGARNADLAIMTGHVAQFFLTDDDWHATLVAVHDALRPGGTLAFETRNPDVRRFQAWRGTGRGRVEDPHAGAIEFWSEVADERDGIVSYASHFLFVATGEEVVASGQLRFRTEAELLRTLAAARFSVQHVFGDWDRRPIGPSTPERIVVATR